MVRRRPRVHGFTLVELLITIAVVGILAAIAVPTWGVMVSRSRQVEAKGGLHAIYTLEIAYFGEHNTYGSLAQIGFVNEGTARYGYMLRNEPGGFVPPSEGMDLGGSDFPSLWEGGGGFGDGDDDDDGTNLPDDDDDDGNYNGNADDDDDDGLCGWCEPPADDDDDGGGGGGSAGFGNPHYDADSFEAVAVGKVSRAPAPNDIDVWIVDQTNTLENINVGY